MNADGLLDNMHYIIDVRGVDGSTLPSPHYPLKAMMMMNPAHVSAGVWIYDAWISLTCDASFQGACQGVCHGAC